jgi:hypothetical protein
MMSAGSFSEDLTGLFSSPEILALRAGSVATFSAKLTLGLLSYAVISSVGSF